MGRSAKIARVGKTKADKDRIKIAKNSVQTSNNKIAKPASASSSSTMQKKHLQEIEKALKKSNSGAAAMNVDTPKNTHMNAKKHPKNYVTQGMPDYVTLLKTRKSGDKLLQKTLARKTVVMK